ncbi:hypothetical protein [Kingella kingae]|uniref:hypothetical protein n=1 Tax=Kingella kingae TaxID=504 RepID=UPI000421D98A|nr:hypothetical protein [Kingella kingae]
MQSQREWLEQHIVQQYGALPEFLWTKYPTYAMYRHSSNRKWFAIVMRVQARKLGWTM